MAFEKGRSGNPGGRSAAVLDDGRTLADVAREHTVEAIATLVIVMRDEGQSGAARVSAANAVLDRAWGRPKQEMGVEVKNDFDLIEALERGRQRVLACGAEKLRCIDHGAG